VTDAERIARLEEAVRDLVAWVTSNQRSKLDRQIGAQDAGARLGEFLDAIEAEADLREAG
jgi:hypothetical protein